MLSVQVDVVPGCVCGSWAAVLRIGGLLWMVCPGCSWQAVVGAAGEDLDVSREAELQRALQQLHALRPT